MAYDVVCPSDYMIQKMIENDLLAEIDFDNIPNIDQIDPEYMERSKAFDPENKYSVPYTWGTVGILYNDKRLEELGESAMGQLQRRVVLSVMDRRWREHLYEMDYLKEGIGLRAMAQRDPLIEYEREGHLMFNEMTAGIKEDVVGYVYNLEVQVEQTKPVVPQSVTNLLKSTSATLSGTATGAAAGAAATRTEEIGRAHV